MQSNDQGAAFSDNPLYYYKAKISFGKVTFKVLLNKVPLCFSYLRNMQSFNLYILVICCKFVL